MNLAVWIVVVVAFASILTNVALVALSLKLYTEHFKDQAITSRMN